MKPESAYIYVIGAPTIQAVKIGYAADVKARMSGLQIGSPLPLVLMWQRLLPNAPDIEAALHLRFANERLRGEWFDLGQDAVRIVREACEEAMGNLPPNVLMAAAHSPNDGLPILLPHQLVWRDAGRWFASLKEHPEFVTVKELIGHIHAFTDGQGAWLWSRLSDQGTAEIIREAYTERLNGPEEIRADHRALTVRGAGVPVRLIGRVWEQLKKRAQSDPAWAPHCGVPLAATTQRHETDSTSEEGQDR